MATFGYLAKHSGQISVKRESKESRNRGYEEMKKSISEGYSIILFPEGGWRNKGDKKSKNPYNLKKIVYCMSLEMVPLDFLLKQKSLSYLLLC